MEIISKDWDEAQQWQRDSAIKGEFKLDNPDAGHDAQHNAWMADKIADGWVAKKKMRCLRHITV
jgi:hypothetical protein